VDTPLFPFESKYCDFNSEINSFFESIEKPQHVIALFPKMRNDNKFYLSSMLK
jgi:hypothetical protein